MGTAGETACDLAQGGVSTAVGHVRRHNEDSYLVAPEIGLWVVADGMGGHSAGEVASQIACETIANCVREGKSLSESISGAEKAISEAILKGEGSEGMGTTVVAAKVDGPRYEIAWVGDSRAYLWHDNRLRQLTHDHSLVQELLDQHVITEDEARAHPNKSVLSRCLGGGTTGRVEIDRIQNSFYANEILILCSDGISGEVPFHRIEQKVRELTKDSVSVSTISEDLIALALEHGGNDNATAIVISAPADAPRRMRQTAPRKAINAECKAVSKRWSVKWISIILVALLLIGLIVTAAFIFEVQQTSPTSDVSSSQLYQITNLPNFSPALFVGLFISLKVRTYES